MSRNAVKAYEAGERPMSRWKKEDILLLIKAQIEGGAKPSFTQDLGPLPRAVLQELFLYPSSWHHTSAGYQETDFYAFADTRIHTLTDEEIVRAISAYEKRVRREKAEREICRYAVMKRYVVDKRTRPHSQKLLLIPGVVKGCWFYYPGGRCRRNSKQVKACPSYKNWPKLLRHYPWMVERKEETVHLMELVLAGKLPRRIKRRTISVRQAGNIVTKKTAED